MAKERLFWTGSTRIINDPRPSALDLRVYACVSLHDGMSLFPGKKGRGCYATFATLTAEVGCDAANLSRSLKRLVEWGYLREERQTDRRRKVYRLTWYDRDSWRSRQQDSWRNDQQSHSEIVGRGESGNGGNPPQTEPHYSSLKGLNLPKEELNSSEEATSNVLRIDGSLSDDGNLDLLERALKSGSPIARVDWHVFLKLNGVDDRAQQLFNQLTTTMTGSERKASATKFLDKWQQRQRASPAASSWRFRHDY